MIKVIKSKKGFTLLELMVTIIILVLVITAVVAGVVLSQQVVVDNNLKEKVSAQGSETADLLITTFKGTPYDDLVKSDGTPTDKFLDLQKDDVATPKKDKLSSLKFIKNTDNFAYDSSNPIQYKLEKVTGADSIKNGNTVSSVDGIKITVCVYYENGQKSLKVNGFAASNAIVTS